MKDCSECSKIVAVFKILEIKREFISWNFQEREFYFARNQVLIIKKPVFS